MVVSVVHIQKGATSTPTIDGRRVKRVSAYLVEGSQDESPTRLAANLGKAYVGSYVLGKGFTFDDEAAAKGTASSLEDMRQVILKNPRNASRIFPFIGGEEVNTDPCHTPRRYVIDFGDMPLGRVHNEISWFQMSPDMQAKKLRDCLMPEDYPGDVAEDWEDLITIIFNRVKPQRDSDNRENYRSRWWRFAERRPGLYKAIEGLNFVFVNSSKAAPQFAIAILKTGIVYSQNLNVFAIQGFANFSIMQSRVHELWARFFGTTMKDDLTYAIEDCFRSFPFLPWDQTDECLNSNGAGYCEYRATLMKKYNEGLTKAYNRFHDRDENSADINELRRLHDAMDHAVLRAYGWEDLIPRAVPQFLDEANEDDHKYQGRYFWSADVRDEVLARLLSLNSVRAAEEKASGIAQTGTTSQDEDALEDLE